ncbi:MAG: phasin family protein [Xanthobacteraceae bacterium]
MEEDNEDQKQFFKDLSATEEQAVQEVRGFEENYYSLVQAMMPALPWLADFNKKLQSYTEQNFAAAYQFTRELSQAKDMQDFVRIHTAYILKCLQFSAAQMVDFAETYTGVASGAIKAPPIHSE